MTDHSNPLKRRLFLQLASLIGILPREARAVASDPPHDLDVAAPVGGMSSDGGTVWARAVRWYDVREFGAVGGQKSDGANINAAITYTHNNRGRLQLGSAEYLTEETIILPSEVTIAGNGKTLTTIKATPAAAADKMNVIETQYFAENTGTSTKLVDDRRMTWGISLSGLSVDGGWNQDFGTAVKDPSRGRGISIYGRRYEVRDVGVYNCSGVGFYTECGEVTTPPTGWYNNYRNNQDGVIEDLDILRTAYEGFLSFGPGDTYINRITVGLVGDTDHIGVPINSLVFPGEYITGFVLSVIEANGASGTHEIGVIHTHTCWNGWNFRALGGRNRLVRLKAENLIAEGGLGSVYLQNGVYAQIGKINTRNNNVLAEANAAAFADVRLSSSLEIDIGSIEGRRRSPAGKGRYPALTGVRIDQDKVQIGRIKYEGNGQPGHAVTVEAGRKHIHIGSVFAANCRGEAQDGEASASFYSKPMTDGVTVGNLMSQLSDYGWLNASTGKVAVLSGHSEVSRAFASNVAGVQLNAVPANQYIRESRLTATSLSGAVLKPGANVLATAQTVGLVTEGTAAEQRLTVAHGMWRTPDFQREVSLHILYNGAVPSAAPAIQPVSSDAVNVTFKVVQTAPFARAADNATIVNLKI